MELERELPAAAQTEKQREGEKKAETTEGTDRAREGQTQSSCGSEGSCGTWM